MTLSQRLSEAGQKALVIATYHRTPPKSTLLQSSPLRLETLSHRRQFPLSNPALSFFPSLVSLCKTFCILNSLLLYASQGTQVLGGPKSSWLLLFLIWTLVRKLFLASEYFVKDVTYDLLLVNYQTILSLFTSLWIHSFTRHRRGTLCSPAWHFMGHLTLFQSWPPSYITLSVSWSSKGWSNEQQRKLFLKCGMNSV